MDHNQFDCCPYKKGKFGHGHIEREDRVRTKGEGIHLQDKKRSLQMKLTLPPP